MLPLKKLHFHLVGEVPSQETVSRAGEGTVVNNGGASCFFAVLIK